MNDFSDLLKADNNQPARSIRIVDAQGLESWLGSQPERVRALATAQKFRGKPHEFAILPGEEPANWSVVAGVASVGKLGPWCLAKLAEALPEGAYRLAEGAAGAWAGQIGAMAGAPITIVPGRGVMIALNHRLVNTVVNRCKPPAEDGPLAAHQEDAQQHQRHERIRRRDK